MFSCRLKMLILIILRNECVVSLRNSIVSCEWQSHWQPLSVDLDDLRPFNSFQCLSELNCLCLCVFLPWNMWNGSIFKLLHCIVCVCGNKSENMHVLSMFTWKTCGITKRQCALIWKTFLKCITFSIANHFLSSSIYFSVRFHSNQMYERMMPIIARSEIQIDHTGDHGLFSMFVCIYWILNALKPHKRTYCDWVLPFLSSVHW